MLAVIPPLSDLRAELDRKKAEHHLEQAREAVKRVLLDAFAIVANDAANVFQLEGETFRWELVRPDPALLQDLLTPHTQTREASKGHTSFTPRPSLPLSFAKDFSTFTPELRSLLLDPTFASLSLPISGTSSPTNT